MTGSVLLKLNMLSLFKRSRAMRRIFCWLTLIIILIPSATQAGDAELFLNAFGETATAYLNDSFLLLGTIGDHYAAQVISKEAAMEIAQNVQKRVRIIRAKLRGAYQRPLSPPDRQLISLLDNAYACMDHLAWALMAHVGEKSTGSAQRFEDRRVECLKRIEKVRAYDSGLPLSPELPEPLSTR
jgi:hypothetical protein